MLEKVAATNISEKTIKNKGIHKEFIKQYNT